MAVKITKKTKLPKSFKLPRWKKKAFKNHLVGSIMRSITVNPAWPTFDSKKIVKNFMKSVYNVWHMDKYNITNYKGTTIAFDSNQK